MTRPTLVLQEWSRVGPDQDPRLRGRTLTGADRRLLERLADTSLRVTELRDGLEVAVGPHLGSVTLSSLRIDLVPKLGLIRLLEMAAYAFGLGDLTLVAGEGTYRAGHRGLTDLLGLALLRAVEKAVRGGLRVEDRQEEDWLAAPRGRVLAPRRPPGPRVACRYRQPTLDHPLNRALAGSLGLAARLVADRELAAALRRGGRRLFADLSAAPVPATEPARLLGQLDRRAGHYRPALTLGALLAGGARLEDHTRPGPLELGALLLDGNRLFEAFVGRWLVRHAPSDMTVSLQEGQGEAFAYLSNPAGWRRPRLRPDFVLRRNGRIVAVGDAKYRDHSRLPPASGELYQLTAYGLAHPLPVPREVLLFYPRGGQGAEEAEEARLHFAPGEVHIRLVGVPVDRLLGGDEEWWPRLGATGRTVTEP